MTASVARPESRSNWRVAGMRASAKANRSRTVTGAEWWLRPMTMRFIDSGFMQRRQEKESRISKQNEEKTTERAPGETASAPATPAHDKQEEISEPNDSRPDN